MRIGIFLLAILFLSNLQAQLNCNTLKGQFGDSVICYHAGGQRSTLEYRDAEHDNYRKFLAFDTKGTKIFEGGHGYRHGGGSLDVSYYPNGSIRSARSTFQPDGGIQYYDVTTFFKEDGTIDHTEDNSWDRQLTVPTYVAPQEYMEQTVYEKETVQFVLKNLSGRKVNLLVISTKDPNDRRLISIKKNKEYSLGYFEKGIRSNSVFDHCRIEVLPSKKTFKTLFIVDDQMKTKEKELILIIASE